MIDNDVLIIGRWVILSLFFIFLFFMRVAIRVSIHRDSRGSLRPSTSSYQPEAKGDMQQK